MLDDTYLPRIIVITCHRDASGWLLEIDDGGSLDPWARRAYLAEALAIAEAEVAALDRLDDDDD